MTTKVAINGFGRIGRCVFRAYLENFRKYKNIEIVAINDLTPIATNAHLLKYDSVHGPFRGSVEVNGDNMIIEGKAIKVYCIKDVSTLPWKDLGIDIVYECTGLFTDRESASMHIKAGAKKVIISAPAKDSTVKTLVVGVNGDDLLKTDDIVSNGSCTTNCLAPIAKVLDREVGIVRGHMTTIHSFTNDQRTVDCAHKDLRRARAASISMIPTTTGAAKAVALVLPQLKGKLDGVSIRVPTPDVSFVDLSFEAKKDTTVDEIHTIIQKAANSRDLKGILEYTKEELVSVDFIHNSSSSIFDMTQTKVIGGKFVRIGAWYDNEWGFSNRMLDTTLIWMNKMDS
ncbi:MAG: type I glyceraldehyde-3-phosphate dehydrogenase [Rickettsiales bacterium]|jgi:glyceraldehyde 3-phosphate dehydrogenase|nr:type I glyceraldehyde-3-phosphate dehydrogenase [Rickettsiales bacterium]